MPRFGILHRQDLALHRGLHLGVFKGQIGALHGTVDERQILTVAKGLGTDDMAVHQRQPFGEPSEIFALDGAESLVRAVKGEAKGTTVLPE